MNQSNSPRKSSYQGPRSRRLAEQRRRKKRTMLVGGVGAAAAAILVGTVIFWPGKEKGQTEILITETESTEAPIEQAVTVNGISLEGMSREEAKKTLTEAYPWNLRISDGSAEEEKTLEVSDLVEPSIDALLDEIFSSGQGGDYTLKITGVEEAAKSAAEAVSKAWDVKAQNARLDHFDEQKGKFVFTEGKSGKVVDQEKLEADIKTAVESGNYDQVIKASFVETAPEDSETVKASYKTLATFTTKTTSNEKRNTNVRLAAEALNGTIVMPGEEFSFNEVVGQRTEKKGYQVAAAYSSGEVVQEVGGGVCQISSTLYRVVFQSGMEITYRRSHTFEPNYVTPGQDAAISWDQPDFRFINRSKGPICIRASYADQKATVSIYGIPVLEEGITWDLDSEKVGEVDPPEPTYIEDQTLDPGTEKVEKAGTNGTTWVTYKVVYKDGKEIERVKDHEKTYKGHAAVIRRNTSDVKLSPEETEPSSETTTAPVVDGMPDDYVPGGGMTVSPEPSLEASKETKDDGAKETTRESVRETSSSGSNGGPGVEETESTASVKPTPPEETLTTIEALNP